MSMYLRYLACLTRSGSSARRPWYALSKTSVFCTAGYFEYWAGLNAPPDCRCAASARMGCLSACNSGSQRSYGYGDCYPEPAMLALSQLHPERLPPALRDLYCTTQPGQGNNEPAGVSRIVAGQFLLLLRTVRSGVGHLSNPPGAAHPVPGNVRPEIVVVVPALTG